MARPSSQRSAVLGAVFAILGSLVALAFLPARPQSVPDEVTDAASGPDLDLVA